MNKKTLFILISLSLLAGIGLAGGLYLVSTPTNIAPRASDANPAVATPRREAESFGSGERTAGATLSGPVTRQEIIDSFGQNTPRADLNADGAVNSLDLAAFDKKLKP